jgi:ATP-dependent DNA helicase RecG
MRFLENSIDLFHDDVPASIREKNRLRDLHDTLRAIHFPKNIADFENAKREIGYRELFRFQKIGIEKKYESRKTSLNLAPNTPLDVELMQSLIASLPFPLTNKQKIVLFQILKDMESPYAMSRMLQ